MAGWGHGTVFCHPLTTARELPGVRAGLAASRECAIAGASSLVSRVYCGPETLMLMAGREQVNEEKPSAPFRSSAAFRGGFVVALQSAFQPVVCAVPTTLLLACLAPKSDMCFKETGAGRTESFL